MNKQIKKATKYVATAPAKHFDGWAFTLVLIWMGLTIISLIGA